MFQVAQRPGRFRRVAITAAGHKRSARSSFTIRGGCHGHPPRWMAVKALSTHARRLYQAASAWSGGRSVTIDQGSFPTVRAINRARVNGQALKQEHPLAPLHPRTGAQGRHRLIRTVRQAEVVLAGNAQEGMPTPTPDVLRQPAGIQVAVGPDRREPIAGPGVAYPVEQPLPMRTPGCLPMRRQDLPGDGDGAAAGENTDDQRQTTLPSPPGTHPAEAWREARLPRKDGTLLPLVGCGCAIRGAPPFSQSVLSDADDCDHGSARTSGRRLPHSSRGAR